MDIKKFFSKKVQKALWSAILSDIILSISWVLTKICRALENLDIVADRFFRRVWERVKVICGAIKYKFGIFSKRLIRTIEVRVLSVISTGEFILICIILILLGILIIMGIQQSEANSYIEILERDLNTTSADYTEQYQENVALYSELNYMVDSNKELKSDIEDLKAKLKESRRSAAELETETIRELIKLSSETYGVDPYLVLAISRHETGNWTSGLCINSNNFGGLRGSSGWLEYDTAMEGINALCKTLKWYKNNGMDSIRSMAYTYCPDGTSEWISTVTKFYNEEKKKG